MTKKRHIKRHTRTPERISITFRKADLEEACDYAHNTKCLMATALRRRGYTKVAVGGYGSSDIHGVRYETDPSTPFGDQVIDYGDDGRGGGGINGYKSELVGTKVILRRNPL